MLENLQSKPMSLVLVVVLIEIYKLPPIGKIFPWNQAKLVQVFTLSMWKTTAQAAEICVCINLKQFPQQIVGVIVSF